MEPPPKFYKGPMAVVKGEGGEKVAPENYGQVSAYFAALVALFALSI